MTKVKILDVRAPKLLQRRSLERDASFTIGIAQKAFQGLTKILGRWVQQWQGI